MKIILSTSMYFQMEKISMYLTVGLLFFILNLKARFPLLAM